LDVTVLALMTLLEIETVAPVPLNGGWSSCDIGIQTPPPNVTSGSGFELFTPPVIVTPSIDTTSASGASARRSSAPGRRP
jgi:hypothetical protein